MQEVNEQEPSKRTSGQKAELLEKLRGKDRRTIVEARRPIRPHFGVHH